jgi:4a-hydroxytetrahydrobiopterin dehydratase
MDEVSRHEIQQLASGKIVPCKNTSPLTNLEAEKRLKALQGWSLQSSSIQKQFRFKSYLLGLEFACTIGKIAEHEDHHPDMAIGWRRVTINFSTHAIKGLSQNDFVMAAKTELEYRRIAATRA